MNHPALNQLRPPRPTRRIARHGWRGASTLIALAAAAALGGPALARQQDANGLRLNGRIQPRTTLQVPRSLPYEEELYDVRIDPEVRELVGRLARESFADREAAMQSLLASTADASQLCALLGENGMTPEQRCRLLEVLRRRLIATPRGALGISMQERQAGPLDPGGVEVTDLLAGLPAEKALRVGDRITHIGGQPIVSRRDLIVIVQSKMPGQSIMLDVSRPRRNPQGNFVRDEESGRVIFDAIQTPLTLGSATDLRDPETGLPQDAGLVGEARAQEAAEARRRYAPRPRTIEVRGSGEATFIGSLPAPHVTDEEVETHYIIRNLLQDAGAMTEGQRIVRRRQLEALREMANDPGLPPRDRELLKRITERFEEIIAK